MENALHAGAAEPGLKLIETLGWNGAALGRLGLHLDRLERSAELLGWRCDRVAVEAALLASVPVGAARMRVTLDANGVVEVTAAALPEGRAVWSVGLAEARLWSGDPWLQVKSTRRAVYDAARAGLGAGLDEVVFLNERGEVCDGTITTLFFDRGQGMRTPPLMCGLLPGVLRAEMNLAEEVLLVDELPKVRLWVGNSLRGLMDARWVG